jgi:hypothetical protein
MVDRISFSAGRNEAHRLRYAANWPTAHDSAAVAAVVAGDQAASTPDPEDNQACRKDPVTAWKESPLKTRGRHHSRRQQTIQQSLLIG